MKFECVRLLKVIYSIVSYSMRAVHQACSAAALATYHVLEFSTTCNAGLSLIQHSTCAANCMPTLYFYNNKNAKVQIPKPHSIQHDFSWPNGVCMTFQGWKSVRKKFPQLSIPVQTLNIKDTIMYQNIQLRIQMVFETPSIRVSAVNINWYTRTCIYCQYHCKWLTGKTRLRNDL